MLDLEQQDKTLGTISRERWWIGLGILALAFLASFAGCTAYNLWDRLGEVDHRCAIAAMVCLISVIGIGCLWRKASRLG